MKQCICEICNCGRHRCPHKTRIIYSKDGTRMLSAYAEQFPAYTGMYRPRQSLKPIPELDEDRGVMEGMTTYKKHFIAHEVKPRPPRRLAQYKPKSGKMTTIPTYKDDFRQWDICRRQVIKPAHNYRPPSGKFAGVTHYQENFVPRAAAPRKSCTPSHQIQILDGPFESVTSNQLVFVAHPLEPRRPRPKQTYRPSDQPMEKRSMTHEDFQAWEINVRQPIIRRQEMHKANGKMEDLTTFKTDFIPHELRPTKSFKPPNQLPSCSDPMEDSTTYGREFTPKRISVCPASYEVPLGYTFQEENEDTGHKYFRKMTPADDKGCPET